MNSNEIRLSRREAGNDDSSNAISHCVHASSRSYRHTIRKIESQQSAFVHFFSLCSEFNSEILTLRLGSGSLTTHTKIQFQITSKWREEETWFPPLKNLLVVRSYSPRYDSLSSTSIKSKLCWDRQPNLQTESVFLQINVFDNFFDY